MVISSVSLVDTRIHWTQGQVSRSKLSLRAIGRNVQPLVGSCAETRKSPAMPNIPHWAAKTSRFTATETHFRPG